MVEGVVNQVVLGIAGETMVVNHLDRVPVAHLVQVGTQSIGSRVVAGEEDEDMSRSAPSIRYSIVRNALERVCRRANSMNVVVHS